MSNVDILTTWNVNSPPSEEVLDDIWDAMCDGEDDWEPWERAQEHGEINLDEIPYDSFANIDRNSDLEA